MCLTTHSITERGVRIISISFLFKADSQVFFFSDNIEPEEIIENVTSMQIFFDLIVCYLTTYQSANHHFTT